MNEGLLVTKAGGAQEPYRREQLFRSLERAGASRALAEKVIAEVEQKVTPGISTQKLWHIARTVLHQEEKGSGIRYGLKQALLELGPTGFPFERFIGEILKAYGYEVTLDQIVRGYCVQHEVDVIAKKEEKHFLVEAKYHNEPGIRSDVKVALYVFARFQDIRKAWEREPQHENEFHQTWLVTNTKCTSDAIQFAECAGLRIISWQYPEHEGLEAMIEAKKLYPVTILPALHGDVKFKFAQAGLMLAKDLLTLDLNQFAKERHVPLEILETLREEATAII